MKRLTSLTTNLRKDARHQVTNELFPCPKNWIRRLGISVEVECKVRRFIKLNNMEIQFWGYESGNILATIAGAGGFTLFGNTIRDVLQDSSLNAWSKVFYLASEHPDATVTLGLLLLLLCAPLVRNPIAKLGNIDLMNVIDTLLFALAIFVLLYAMNSDTSWLSVSGASFVVASSFLRYSKKNPLLLKIGGLVLSSGGICLGMFGLTLLAQSLETSNTVETIMASLTIGTGLYVTGASLLTYEGGVFQTISYRSSEVNSTTIGWIPNLLNPENGIVARFFKFILDKPILALNRYIIKPIIFWVPAHAKLYKPFKTSMLARLPWRIATALAALWSSSTQSWAFAAANASWAIGDIAIGSEDW